MKLIFPVLIGALLCSCKREQYPIPIGEGDPIAPLTAAASGTAVKATDAARSAVRVNSTSQSWNPAQPWEKNPPNSLRSLGIIVKPGQVLTSAEMVADATYLELELIDGSKTAEAKTIAVDYEANLALLTLKSEADSAAFFESTTPIVLAKAPTIGDTLQVLQIEDNGTPLMTEGKLQTVDVSASFLTGQAFLGYLVKASMQSAASSFSLPVIHDGDLAGILVSYDNEDQISDVLSVDVIQRFLADAAEGDYAGFPSLGISISTTIDPIFRNFLKLTPTQGGIFVSKVRPSGAAEKAGVKQGDVILAVDSFEIDPLGYYQHPNYGSVFWGHLIKGEKSAGDTVKLSILRNGEPQEITATLTRDDPRDVLVPHYQFDRAPNFLVKGGLIFQELNRPLLEAYGEEWTSRAPLNLLDAYENPDKYEDKFDRIVFLSGSIPTPATIGYESLRNLIVKKVNDVEIKDMKSLIEAFKKPNADKLHSIEFLDEDFTVHLDESLSSMVDAALLQRGINSLSRAE
jgi:S1-C subfamily serine protease